MYGWRRPHGILGSPSVPICASSSMQQPRLGVCSIRTEYVEPALSAAMASATIAAVTPLQVAHLLRNCPAVLQQKTVPQRRLREISTGHTFGFQLSTKARVQATRPLHVPLVSHSSLLVVAHSVITQGQQPPAQRSVCHHVPALQRSCIHQEHRRSSRICCGLAVHQLAYVGCPW